MRRTGQFRSLGGKRSRRIAALLTYLSWGCAASADDYALGLSAFADQNYQAAAGHWAKAAESGSAEAHLQLGLMADLGLGKPASPHTAFRHYMTAAELGNPEAAFNVGVMLDTGTGVQRDSIAAGVWYARAALLGSHRGAYNLGLLYRDGSGVPANPTLAAYWLESAAEALPGAREAVAGLDLAEAPALTVPVPLMFQTIEGNGAASADVVWMAQPAPKSSVFVLQIVSDGQRATDSVNLHTWETSASALRIPSPDGLQFWRVSQVDQLAGRYIASNWQTTDSPEPPVGLVTIVVMEQDRKAGEIARWLTSTLRGSGLAIQIIQTDEAIDGSLVTHRYAQDSELAEELGRFLPRAFSAAVRRSDDSQAGPGEVVINLTTAPHSGIIP